MLLWDRVTGRAPLGQGPLVGSADVADHHDPGRTDRRSRVSRRGFLGAVGGLAVGAAAVGTATASSPSGASGDAGAGRAGVEPFYGPHQGGITTVPQSHTYLASLDVTTTSRATLAGLLREWTTLAARLARCGAAGALAGAGGRPAPDSGEALDLGPARLTVNFGFGPGLFVADGRDRFGLANSQPWQLVDLPPFAGDQLIESKTGGDLTVQACADDPQVAFHAVRQLVRVATGVAQVRWSQAGYNETPAGAGTPRSLLGFKDGTANPRSPAELADSVWVQGEGPGWMREGTFLVVRRIRLALPRWDGTSVGDQERVIGRHKLSGAPLGGDEEFETLDLGARDRTGNPVIPMDAHVRLASAQENWGQTMLRRSYAYNDGVGLLPAAADEQRDSTFDAGLLFAAYQRNARFAFIPIYRKLSERDALREFAVHTGGAIVAIPPGAADERSWVGQPLFES